MVKNILFRTVIFSKFQFAKCKKFFLILQNIFFKISMQEFSEIEIVSLSQKPETRKQVFNYIVEKFKQPLYWHIRKIVISHTDTDDVLQNTFIKVWKNLDRFKGDSKLFTWLYRISTNESLTFLKQKHPKRFLFLGDVNKELLKTLESDSYFCGDRIQKKLQKAILSLPEKQRIVFNMKYFDDITYEEISQILETSVGALKASFHHAVKKIEAYLEKHQLD